MIGIIIGLIASWLILWIYKRKNLEALGLIFSKRRIIQFAVGLLIAGVCCAVYFLSVIKLSGSSVAVNQEFGIRDFLKSSFWVFKSVLFEELLFRGALLYIAIQTLGKKMACILSAIAFGIYHWFSYGIFGQPMQMISVFLITGIGGLVFADAFAKTKSMYLPLGLHLGWNLITIVVFSQGPLGEQLLISHGGEQVGGGLSLFLLLFQVLVFPVVVYLYLRRANR